MLSIFTSSLTVMPNPTVKQDFDIFAQRHLLLVRRVCNLHNHLVHFFNHGKVFFLTSAILSCIREGRAVRRVP